MKTENLVWRVRYKDGTLLHEVEPDGTQHKFSDITLPEIDTFELIVSNPKLEDFENEESEFTTKTVKDVNVMVKMKTYYQELPPVYSVKLDGDKRLVFRRRGGIKGGQHLIKMGNREIPMPIDKKETIIIIGWQKTINGENVQALNYIHPNGRIELAGSWGSDAAHAEINMPKSE